MHFISEIPKKENHMKEGIITFYLSQVTERTLAYIHDVQFMF